MKPLKFFLLALALPSIINLSLKSVSGIRNLGAADDANRRILHQPLFAAGPPAPQAPAMPSPKPNPPFFHHVPPAPARLDHPETPIVTPTILSTPFQPPDRPGHQIRTIVIAVSVSNAALVLLLALAFFLYQRRRNTHTANSNRLVGNDSQQVPQVAAMAAASSFIRSDTVEPSIGEPSNAASYQMPNKVHMRDTRQPSPELQPMPPLAGPPNRAPPPIPSDEETSFYSPHASDVMIGESPFSPISHPIFPAAAAPIQDSDSTAQFQGVSLKTHLSDSSSHVEQVVTPPPHIQQSQLRHKAEILSPLNWKEKYQTPPSPPPDLVLPPLVDNPVPQEEESLGPLGENPRPSETWVPRMPDRRLSRPPSLTVWIETPDPSVEDNHGTSSS
ncbi:formin-like protein 6 [Magnolia sinica]|uniref:formin-like protein 6 n=1 Tax=Magnolia sinica TaxID=86752 RepID=UPI00265927DD|nr:formin-like protein 6 [Magnolia sinica]